ncbi:glycerol kinase GlpK [Paracraurococcus ruber]|uniref:Glycerol kinase n=1 Tax=Paracraurococcus ruber TaxID=77675 RepID=A0ABS1CX79_9PROT|nr:glycerol kinase GlpK [Paracraurococcus ruber]MBK1659141.1 glycerol kinase [Paracraurococcus ruber]TDG31915.1 glycerol kinase [Paracraurococcus ruber]
MPAGHILALDQGTTSTRAILFRAPDLAPVAVAQQEFQQHYPASGWVEHAPEDLWDTSLAVMREAIGKAGLRPEDIAGIGIANQRETTLVWDRRTGKPIHRAIVWQDRRTASACAALREAGHAEAVAAATGLLIDPYFSATKVTWLLDNVAGARAAAERGDLAFGTVDSFLLWRLTGGRVHATDATNAARTMLFDIRAGRWDAGMCALHRVPMSMLPEVRDCAADFGTTDPALLGAAIPVLGIAGDQQAATVGQACFRPGMLKSTYGTGCFALLNTGDAPVASRHRLLTTIAYQLAGRRTYALEGAIFVAGAAVQWLRDGLGVIKDAAESGRLAAQADPAMRCYLVPAFVGLGVPHWDAEARGAIHGLTRGTGPADFARAALESVGYQTRDLLEAMQADIDGVAGAAGGDSVLRVDGGMVASDWAMQFLADILGAPVDRPVVRETTALGAAYLAGLRAGLCPPPEEFAAAWRLERRFAPAMAEAERASAYAGWQRAVRRTLSAGY